MKKLSSLIIHPTYTSVHIGLCTQDKIYAHVELEKQKATQELVPKIKKLLEDNILKLNSLEYIIAHCGPGPFTTLRVALATANGLAWAAQKPMIGVDGLEAFIDEYKDQCKTRYLVVILNAFCADIYYAIYDSKNKNIKIGCQPGDIFLSELKQEIALQNITFMGNAVALYHDILRTQEHTPELCSLESVRLKAYEHIYAQKTSKQLMPIYLKASSAKIN